MRLAIAYNTMNKLELTKQSFPVLRDGQHALLWSDGSTDPEALSFFEENRHLATKSFSGVRGGADAGIAHSLTRLLEDPEYTHVGLVESDVLLDADWLEPTIELFREGLRDGLNVGAVSARSYVDRVLVQRDKYAVMLNIGAGMIIFTRDAAQIVLETFSTGWWPTTRKVFAQVSGVDIATFACFHGNEQWTTTDWKFEASLARMGYAALALTPAKASMIGQVPPLHQQGLELTQGPIDVRRNEQAFETYRSTLSRLGVCVDHATLSDSFPWLQRHGEELLVFPHQLGKLAGTEWAGTTELQNSQGYGPFAYRAGPGGASLSVHISGSASFQCSGGIAGATVTIEDRRSGFRASPHLPPATEVISIAVPGGPIPRQVTVQLAEGAVFYGLLCNDPQRIDTTWKFDWKQLPAAPGEAQRSGEAK